MQMPPAETIPPMPDETNPGPVPPLGPGEIAPDNDLPFPDEDEPGDAPAFPPERAPFPDDVPMP